MRKSIQIPFKCESGEVVITLSALTREQNRLYGQLIMPIILRNCERMIEISPTLRNRIDGILSECAVSGCQIPGEIGLTAALTPDGMEVLIGLMMREAHPNPMDSVTMNFFMDEKFSELHSAILELIPLPKKINRGPMSQDKMSETKSTPP